MGNTRLVIWLAWHVCVACIFAEMNCIVDLLSGRPHLESIVLAQIVNSQFRETQRHYFLGAMSAERFLLITSSSPINPEQPIDFSKSKLGDTIYARSSDTDFIKTGDIPIVATRPRSQSEPAYLEKSFEAQQRLLTGFLGVGTDLVKPGSVQWEADRFSAEYAEMPHGTGTVRIRTPDGQDAPESVKARILADIETDPKDRKIKGTLVRCEHKVLTAAEAEAERIANTPAPGSIEAKIMAIFEAREQERLRKGIHGYLVRDPQGRIAEVHFEIEPARHVYLEYNPALQLPAAFPHRIRTFIECDPSQAGVPCQEIIFYSVRLSSTRLDDATFDPRLRLKEGSFFHGVLDASGGTRVPDPKEQLLLNQMIKEKYFKG